MARITGKAGAVYINGTSGANKIADIYNWEMDVDVEMAECGIKGEKHQKYVAGTTTSRVRAQRYTVNPTLASPGAVTAGNSADTAGGTTVTYTLYGIDGGATGPVVTGEGFISRGSLRVPRGMISDELEITGTAMPTIA